MNLRTFTHFVQRTRARPILRSVSYSAAPKTSDPLRILFCGSDEFSCFSLQALHEEHKQNANLIRSIDVIVRPSKPTGRGYKVLSEVPLRTLADKLSLPVHVRDTFTGWDMPQPDGHPINLIIAVSFGLFVPPRLLSAAKYGGLNVHPSLLPDLRGPAPLHHALLNSYTHTGVTIQTLSPQNFDAGAILLQTPPPGIPIPPSCTVAQLHDMLAPRGAAMLVDALRKGLHVPPHPPTLSGPLPDGHVGGTAGRELAEEERGGETRVLRHAPKITPWDRQVLWIGGGGSVRARDVALRGRVLGPLWTHIVLRSGSGRRHSESEGGGSVEGERLVKRAILEDLSVVETQGAAGEMLTNGRLPRGTVTWVQKSGKEDGQRGDQEITAEYQLDGTGVVVHLSDGSLLRIGKIKVEGSTSKPARHVLESIGSK